jgi:hypothetical protein
VKYVDDLVILNKEETVLQGIIGRKIEIGKFRGTWKYMWKKLS